MLTYQWPGNVRELENSIEYAFVVCHDRMIGEEHLPTELSNETQTRTCLVEAIVQKPTSNLESKRILRDSGRLTQLLEENLWNKAEVARILGVSRTAVWKWVLRHGIAPAKN
jgi:transcriptional regulator of acetoin/glycerol metabolism